MATAVAENPRVANKPPQGQYKPVSELKKQYEDFLSTKDPEIRESRQSRHYFHGNQWTTEQLEILKVRRQPYVTYNKIAQRINRLVGAIGNTKQDPKAFARTPKHEQGAELATAALRFVADENKWKFLQVDVMRSCAVDGLAAVELNVEKTGNGEMDIVLSRVAQDQFFYDPRSFSPDFSDAMYLGTAKWVDLDTAKELFPDKAEELDTLISARFMSELGPDIEREVKWTNVDQKKVRIVDHWYLMKGQWCYTMYCAETVLKQGKAYLSDRRTGDTIPRYIAFSCNVDHDGDRYGFVRNLKGPQDEVNQRRAKALWQSVSRRTFSRRGSVGDVEVARREMQRPDGWIEYDGEQSPTADDAALQAQLKSQLEFLVEAKGEIENFAPDAALQGTGATGGNTMSGRAIALIQGAGRAELGPFVDSWKDWKIRVTRAVWCGIQQYWTGERWIRVTDDDGLAQYIQVNKMAIDPMTGMPTIVNAIGQLDVDIILDEGPDTVNMMADFYETIQQVLPPVAPMLSPPKAQALVDMLIENSPIDSAAKKKFREAGQQPPDPMQVQAQQIQLAGEAAKVRETDSKTLLNQAKAQSEGIPDVQAPMAPEQQDHPAEIEARVRKDFAASEKSFADAEHTRMETRLLPQQMQQEALDRQADRQQAAQDAEANRRQAAEQGDADRKAQQSIAAKRGVRAP